MTKKQLEKARSALDYEQIDWRSYALELLRYRALRSGGAVLTEIATCPACGFGDLKLINTTTNEAYCPCCRFTTLRPEDLYRVKTQILGEVA